MAVPGPYSSYGGGITFVVAPGGRSMLNFDIGQTSLGCLPSGSADDHLGILQVPIQPDGSFSATTTASGVDDNSNAKYVFTVNGHFQPATRTALASAGGTWREDITFASGETTSCSSNDQSWTATLYREPPWQSSDIKPGNYSSYGGGIKFSVAPGGKSMLNFDIGQTSLDCVPTLSTTDHLEILQVPIQPDGSFSATTSQSGVFGNSNAKFTYTVAGYFEGPTPPSGAETVAGIWSENIVPSTGTISRCSSGDQIFVATLES